jgi:hypothetical protein
MEKVYICDTCNKNYKSYQTLWKHNKKFHIENHINGKPKVNIKSIDSKPKVNIKSMDSKPKVNIKSIVNPMDSKSKVNINSTDNSMKKYECLYCKLEFEYKQSKYRHQLNCKTKMNLKKNKLIEQNEELIKMVTILLNNKCKVHPKTLEKMQKKINEYNQNNNNGNINNGTINNTYNINIIALGQENISELLSQQEKLNILNRKYQSLYHLIKIVHFNDQFPQFKNIAITNNKTNEAHLYDSDSKSFKVVDKNELITDLIEYRICDIEDFFNELKEQLDDTTKKIIEDVVDKRGDNIDTIDRVKLLVFNNKKNINLK